MTTILYSENNNPAKGANVFIKKGDILGLTNALAKPGKHVILAEDSEDEVIKALGHDYEIPILDPEEIPDGLSAEDELRVEALKSYGLDFEEAAEELGLSLYSVAISKAYNHESRIEKALNYDD